MEIKKDTPDGSMDNPYTSTLDCKSVDRAFKYCLCGDCQTAQLCTPTNDFYDVPGDNDLHCRSCFENSLKIEGIFMYNDGADLPN